MIWDSKFLLCGLFIFQYAYVASSSHLSLNGDSSTTATDENAATIEHEFEICKIQIKTNIEIKTRFAQTTLVYKIKNLTDRRKTFNLPVFLPDNAFVSQFILEEDGENRTAYVADSRSETHGFTQALFSQHGDSIDFAFQNSYRYPVKVKFSSRGTATFYLTYQELLTRKNNQYETLVNIKPGQPVEDFSIEVRIEESDKIHDLDVFPLRSGQANTNGNLEADIQYDTTVVISDTEALVKFSPNVKRQKQLGSSFQMGESEGFSGQFIVRYDVEMNATAPSEIVAKDGYFVHFYSPKVKTETFRGHMVFILDTSIKSKNLEQVKAALNYIFNLLPDEHLLTLMDTKNDGPFLTSCPVNKDNIAKAQHEINNISASDQGDIPGSLKASLEVVEEAKKAEVNAVSHKCLIVLITAGDLTPQNESSEIINNISELNSASVKCSIFTFSFGNEADKFGYQKLSLLNYGFLRDISEGDDGSAQIVNAFRDTPNILLTDVVFDYGLLADTVSTTRWRAFYQGSELVTVGTYGPSSLLALQSQDENLADPSILLELKSQDRNLTGSNITKTSSKIDLERVWAHVTIQQLGDKITVASNEDVEDELIDEATDLSLKYSLVTDFTTSILPERNATRHTAVILRSLIYVPQRTAIQRPRPAHRTDRKKKPKKSARSTLLSKLAWLKTKLDDKDNINLPSGKYKLGLSENITEKPACPKTPFNSAGHCSLLKDCSEVYPLLTSLNVLVEHFCVLKNEYVGVCCPIS